MPGQTVAGFGHERSYCWCMGRGVGAQADGYGAWRGLLEHWQSVTVHGEGCWSSGGRLRCMGRVTGAQADGFPRMRCMHATAG